MNLLLPTVTCDFRFCLRGPIIGISYDHFVREFLEMQNMAAEIKLRAERRAGELLGAMELNRGAEGLGVNQYSGEKVRSHDATTGPRLTDLGITKLQSSRWQQISRIPEPIFEEYVNVHPRASAGSCIHVRVLNCLSKVGGQVPGG